MTLGEWLNEWMQLYVWPAKLARNTKLCYNRAVQAVPGFLLSLPLEELTALHVRRWLLDVARVTPRAAQLDRVMLSKSLRLAGKLGLCRPGLIDEETCPPIDHTPRKAAVLTADQLRAYMAEAAKYRSAPALLLCCCGLRRGEALGARWEALDLEAGTLAVVGQRVGDQLTPLKSAASRRVIALPQQVLTLLACWPHTSEWLCSVSATQVYADHRSALAAAQLPAITLHGLRHTVATIAAMSGEPIKLIQAALGHSHFALTADLYADHLPPVAAVTGRIL